MTLTSDASPGRDDSSSRPGGSVAHDASPVSSNPVRADGVELIGHMQGSGYREPPALARRGDGQTFQLTPLLYLVLQAIDGSRAYDEIAAQVSAAYGRNVSADNVEQLVDGRLRPLGLVARADGSQPEVKRSNPLLALRMKYAVTDPARTRRLTDPFRPLFHPLVAVVLLAAFGWVCWWVLFRKGLASATYEAFDRPALLLLVFAVTVLSAGFHEFGHAAAARYGGATPGVMGAGVYLVWPAFYTDVTDSYRLGRAGRIRTDLGGLYFNAIVAVVVAAVWWATGYDALLLVVATQVLQMVRQLTPLVRFDGYHLLADLTGVPDLFHRIGPTLASAVPGRTPDPAARALKPWARAVVTTWVVAVVPLLLLSFATLAISMPRVMATAWVKVQEQAAAAGQALGDGHVVELGARSLAVVAIAFPVLASVVLAARLVRSTSTTVWRRTEGSPGRRLLAGVVAVALVGGLAHAWWPDPDTYRPVRPYERGALTDLAMFPGTSDNGLHEGRSGHASAVWPQDEPRPTREHPRLAMVLVPRDTAATQESATQRPAWVFPFDKPLAPGPGDNQAVAVNTTDGTVVYDVAMALVWVDGDDAALNRNEAFAAASCTGCAAVAVGFQVVLVIGESTVAVPQNLSTAVNYDCRGCLTYALAVQLFVTLEQPLDETRRAALAALWQQIAQFGQHLDEVPLSQIQARLREYEQQILAIVRPASPVPAATASPSAGATDAATASTGPSAGGTTTAGPSATPSSGSTSGATSGPTAEETTTSTPTSGSVGTAQPTPSSSTLGATEGSSVTTTAATG
jgi:putative peptide zinc metalloprotease protein